MPEIPDIDRLIAEVAARHGVLLKKDDAAFALVTLNRLVLESTIADLLAQWRTATLEFEVAIDRVQQKAGIAIAKHVETAVQELKERPVSAPEFARSSRSPDAPAFVWSALAAFVVGIAVGVLIAGLAFTVDGRI